MLLIYLQYIFETHSILFLIYFQKDKRSEEILYLFNSEDMSEKIAKGEKATFGRQERRNKKAYLFLIVFIPSVNLITLTLMLGNFLDNVIVYRLSHIVNAFIYTLCLISNIYYSSTLYYIMKKMHRYEFKRTYKSIIWSVIVFTIYFVMSFLFELYELVFDKNNSLDLTHLEQICASPQGIFS